MANIIPISWLYIRIDCIKVSIFLKVFTNNFITLISREFFLSSAFADGLSLKWE